MARIAVLANRNNDFAKELLTALHKSRPAHEYQFIDACDSLALTASRLMDCCVYAPSFDRRTRMSPDLLQAARVFKSVAGLENAKFLLISSALIYGTGCGRQALATEEYSAPRNGRRPVCSHWNALEALARESLNGGVQLTILRPATVLASGSWLSRLLRSPFIPTLPGHDPTLQLLSMSDLAEALSCAAEQDRPGIFNIAPSGVVPLHSAARLIRSHRLPVPSIVQRLHRSKETLEYLRYSWTISGSKIKKELGFVPRKSSVTALLEEHGGKPARVAPEPHFDEFGMDRDYIKFYGKTLFKFLCDY